MKVTLDKLTKIFPSRKKNGPEVIAVNNFSFEIPDGKLIGLLGPSGCGKSTTLFMLSGLQKPSSGKIFFGEDDVTNLAPEKRGVGLVFQNYALYPHMTVKQNILFPLQNVHMPKDEALAKVVEVAKLVQIDDLLDRKPSELSGGQQQRVAIARALVKTPRVLLLDEPLSNLDARLRLQTREEIRRIQRDTGVTTVFVTHDQEEAMSISDFIVVMKKGLVQQIGVPQDVYDDPHNLFVSKFLGTPPINVFRGEIKDHVLYIGSERIFDVKSVDDQQVYVGIRPEGFIVDPKGPLTTKIRSVEVMGRDSSIVSEMSESENAVIRSIVDADTKIDPASTEISFSLKAHKVFLFNRDTEERIYLPGDKVTTGYEEKEEEKEEVVTEQVEEVKLEEVKLEDVKVEEKTEEVKVEKKTASKAKKEVKKPVSKKVVEKKKTEPKKPAKKAAKKTEVK